MSEQEHLKRVLADLQAKEKLAQFKIRDARVEAETYGEAIRVVEVELSRFPKASGGEGGRP